MLKIIRSNRVDVLAHALADRLNDDPLPDPMEAERIVLSHRGMARWLQHTLALRLGSDGAGICAQVEFPFPENTFQRLAETIRGTEPGSNAWSRPSVTWALCQAIPEQLNRPELAGLRHYLRAEEVEFTGSRLLSISREIAARFDRYAVYRPELILDWAKKSTTGWPDPQPLEPREEWQKTLWCTLRSRLGESPTEAVQEALRKLRSGNEQREVLPSRLSFFGLPFLPPTWLALIRALGGHMDIDFYLLSPSHLFWGDIRKGSAGEADEEGTTLLSGLGRVGRDFQSMLAEGPTDHTDVSFFIDPDPSSREEAELPTALQRLQSDILHVRERHPNSENPPIPLDPDDRSIRFHAAPGPTRQVEVLHEALLHLLEADHTLEPRDILIMSPDHERFAPLVSAIFARSADPDGPPELPIQVADRGISKTNPVTSALLSVLHLAEGRFPLTETLELLALPVVHRRFGFETSDLDKVRDWLSGAGVRWGRDDQHRDQHGLSEPSNHTWQSGLDRLLIGTAIQGSDRLFHGRSPWDELEGSETEILGRLCEFTHTLFEHAKALREPREAHEWNRSIARLVRDLMHVEDDDRWQILRTLDAVGSWLPSDPNSCPDRPIALAAIRRLLSQVLAGQSRGTGHQTGRATFCAMMPMRSIPFRVIALLGMDDGIFPRNPPALGFDLVEQHRRLGDSLPRDEDRYLLLETLLCARDHLLVTWSGRDPCSGKGTPPAVPIGELLDIVDKSFSVPEGRASKVLTRNHGLHPFTPSSFGRATDGRAMAPWSFEPQRLEAARRLEAEREIPAGLISGQLQPHDRPQRIELSDFVRVMQAPIPHLLRERLQIQIWNDGHVIPDREALELDGLSQWEAGVDLLNGYRVGSSRMDLLELQAARGLLPPGALGEVEFENLEQRIRPVWEVAENLTKGEATTVPVEFEIDGAVLVGTVRDLYGDRRVRVQIGSMKGSHQLAAWIRHLVLVVGRPERDFETTLLAPLSGGRGPVSRIDLVLEDTAEESKEEQAKRHLGTLLDLYRRTMNQPVQLFCEAGIRYAYGRHRGRSEVLAMNDARAGWQRDLRDPVLRHAYGPDEDLRAVADRGDFVVSSESVFGPLVRAGGKPQ